MRLVKAVESTGMASAIENTSWAMVTCQDGIGYLGPEHLVDNRATKMMIIIDSNITVFDKTDVKSVSLLCATSEWIKYEIVLKNRKRYIATFLTHALIKKPGATPAAVWGNLLSGAILFEYWLADIIYKNNTAATTQIAAAPTQVQPQDSVEQPKITVQKVAAPLQAKSKTTVTASKPIPTPAQETPTEKTATTAIKEDSTKPLDLFEKEKLYGYALQMYGNRSYSIAYNVLLRIKGYKDSNKLLLELEDKA